MYSRFTPPADLYASQTAWLLQLDLPGVAQDDLSISVEQSVLTISSKAEEDATPRWFRRLTLPRDASADGITAALADGVLSVEIPRAAPTTRQIAIG